MPYRNHHEENVITGTNSTKLNWKGDKVFSFDSPIGKLSFQLSCEFARKGAQWWPTKETGALLGSLGIHHPGSPMGYGQPAFKFHRELTQEQVQWVINGGDLMVAQQQLIDAVRADADAFKADYEGELVEFVFLGGLEIYLLPVPGECPFEEYWDSIKEQVAKVKALRQWVLDNMRELAEKGWDIDAQFSGLQAIEKEMGVIRFRSSEYRYAGEIVLKPGDPIPLAEPLHREGLKREAARKVQLEAERLAMLKAQEEAKKPKPRVIEKPKLKPKPKPNG